MTEYKLSRYHRTATEFCYHKQGGLWLLYNDSTAPRTLIATISGCDLDGWQWRSEVDGLKPDWEEPSYYPRWRAALAAAVFQFVKAEYQIH